DLVWRIGDALAQTNFGSRRDHFKLYGWSCSGPSFYLTGRRRTVAQPYSHVVGPLFADFQTVFIAQQASILIILPPFNAILATGGAFLGNSKYRFGFTATKQYIKRGGQLRLIGHFLHPYRHGTVVIVLITVSIYRYFHQIVARQGKRKDDPAFACSPH